MAERRIDYNRGVIKRTHPLNGVAIYMYVDTPGDYLNAFGTTVADKLAKEAGFDVDVLSKQKLKRERLAQAREAIEREIDTSDVTREMIVERNGFSVTHIGLGRYVVEDPDGTVMNPTPLSKQIALKLFDDLVPKSATVEDEPEPATDDPTRADATLVPASALAQARRPSPFQKAAS